MQELFDSLGLVSAILGGFAFSFVGALLSVDNKNRVMAIVYGCALSAAVLLMSTALGSVLTALGLRNNYPLDITFMHELLSILFLLGILCFIVATGLSGWLRSRTLGIVSASVGVGALFVVGLVISPFIIFGSG